MPGPKITTLSGFQGMPNFLCGGFLGWFWVVQQEDALLVEGECECFGDHTPLLDPGVAQGWPQQRLLSVCVPIGFGSVCLPTDLPALVLIISACFS